MTKKNYQQVSFFPAKKVLEKPAKIWSSFARDQHVAAEQLEQFKLYARDLLEWNQRYNLTAVTNLSELVTQHFSDSFALGRTMDLSKVASLADIGTGAGFPALPIKIMNPHLKMVLIEVNGKRRTFLKHIIELLGLENVEVCESDWRTFLRKTTHDIDLFVTKAALDEVELARMFRSTSHYRDKKIAYWVSESWQCHKYAKEFLFDIATYSLKRKKRKIAFLALPAVIEEKAV